MLDVQFEQMYLAHKEQVWKIIARYVYLRQDREDLFQEVFLNIHKALPRFRAEAAISTWIYRITINTSLNYLKKQKRHKLLKDILVNLRIIETTEIIEETGTLFTKPLEKLNPRQRMVFVLAEVEEEKLETIAQLLKLPLGTVKSNLHRAKEIVRKELVKDGSI